MSRTVQPRYVPPPCQERTESGLLILRDGSTARLRLAHADDVELMHAFYEQLSPESRSQRFFSSAAPSAKLLASLCNVDQKSNLTLVVTRERDGQAQIVATGSYLARDENSAEVAFAVDDEFQGKGLGTLLLERLALLAVRHGFTRFWAVTHADNKAMRDVFRQSGFAVKEEFDAGEIEVDLSVIPNEASVARLETRDRIATTASLRPFFEPRSVAVVGASRDSASIGYRLLQELVSNRFNGPVYPVNPKATVVGCIRAYASVRELPEAVDLAVIAVPARAVLSVIDDCAARGVRALVVISAGFAEVDEPGRRLQDQLRDHVRGLGMRMVGPNCMGLMNTHPDVSLNASFAPVFPPAGRVAMLSQSGALGLAVLQHARQLQLGLSTFVSVGNKADVSGNDLLQYWEEDPNTDVVLLYLESFGNPRRFARIARRVGLRKPIVAIKSGRSRAGERAAGSHTAALAASDVAVEALFQQTGILRAETLEEMFDLAKLLGSQPIPSGNRVAILTNAGGPGILCADACEAEGLTIPVLSRQVQQQLRAFLPAAASVGNPVDLIASATPTQFEQSIEAVLASGEVDGLIAIFIPIDERGSGDVAQAIRASVSRARAAGADTPVLACLMSRDHAALREDPAQERIPSYTFPESAARALGKAARYGRWRRQLPGAIPDFDDVDIKSARRTCREALAARGAGWLSAEEARSVLQAMKLPVPAGGVAHTAAEAVARAEEVGFPVAVKLASLEIVHKTEAGGVQLDLADAEAVRGAFEKIRDRLARTNQLESMEGVLVQPMLTGGVEVMVGVTQDPLFGPLLAFGLGGIHVEILKDVCFRITPLTDRDAAEMVRSIKGYRLLEGYRGHDAADVEAIEELLLRVSRLVEEVPEIREIDLNPVFALAPGQGCQIADSRIKVAPEA